MMIRCFGASGVRSLRKGSCYRAGQLLVHYGRHGHCDIQPLQVFVMGRNLDLVSIRLSPCDGYLLLNEFFLVDIV